MGPEAGVQKVRAWGPGLETGVVGKSADFVVEAIGTEVGTLGKQVSSHRPFYWALILPPWCGLPGCLCDILLLSLPPPWAPLAPGEIYWT